MNISQFQLHFSEYLHQWCESKRKLYENSHLPSIIVTLIAHGVDLVKSDGKRLRPYMAYLSYTNHGGSNQKEIFQLGLVLELLHIFALIHDDWMDNGYVRRGMPTTHVLMEQILTAQKRNGAKSHAAASQAILLGDLIFNWVYQELDQLKGNAILVQVFHQMVEEVVLGQMLDIDTITSEQISREFLEQKMLLKTASYTFVYPLQLGALLANDQSLQQFYLDLGNALGLGFQIQDDLLDILGTDTQKTAFGDIMNHQHSLCTYYVLNKGSDHHKSLLHNVWGKKGLTAIEKEKLQAMFIDSGAVLFARNEMTKYFERAITLLDQLQDSGTFGPEMKKVIDLIGKRLSV